VVRAIQRASSSPWSRKVTTALHEGGEVLLTVSTPASSDLADPIAGTVGAWKGLVDGEILKHRIRARSEGSEEISGRLLA
jgi:hypothetical protein